MLRDRYGTSLHPSVSGESWMSVVVTQIPFHPIRVRRLGIKILISRHMTWCAGDFKILGVIYGLENLFCLTVINLKL